MLNENSENLTSSEQPPLSPSEQAEEYAKMAHPVTGLWYFIENYCYISDPGKGTIRFEAWPHFEELCRLTLTHDRLTILKARQIGVTWFYVFVALWYALFRPNSNILILSIRQIEATNVKWRCKFVYRHLPEWLQVDIGKDNDEVLEFPALDSAIHSLPATEDSGRSATANLVIIDEWAFQEYARSIYTAILPTVEHGKLIGISTANGQDNLHYNIWQGAKNQLNDFLPIFIPYDVRPGRDAAWWDKMARNMDSMEEAMREYPRDEAEAFSVMANCIFNVASLDKMPLTAGNEWRNFTHVWHTYDQEDQYVAGIDPAPGGGDPSVCQLLDGSGRQAARISTNEEIDIFAKEAFELLKFYGYPPVIIERQGEGATIIRYFIKQGYPEHKIWRPSEGAKRLGWYTTASNRDDILSELRAAVRERGLTIYSKTTVTEFKGFGRDAKGKIQGIYGHDDEVMSMALAWFLFTTVPDALDLSTWSPKEYVDVGSNLFQRMKGKINWSKKDPLLCTFMVYAEHQPRRRCGIHHDNLDEMTACQHQLQT